MASKGEVPCTSPNASYSNLSKLGLHRSWSINEDMLIATLVTKSTLALLESIADIGSRTTALTPCRVSLLASIVASILPDLPAVLASCRFIL